MTTEVQLRLISEPDQPESTRSVNSPEIRVLCGDCREIVPAFDGEFNFVFADPPFNIGHGYQGYDDRKSDDDYARFTQEWVAACRDSLADSGVMALHGPDDLAKRWLHLEDELGLKRIAWINWHYRFGQCNRSNWIDARCHCLIYANGEGWTWNPDEVLVDSDRKTQYADKRVDETEHGGQRLPGTVWGIPSDGKYWGRIQGNAKERRPNHPNQLPEVYLERLMRAYTNPGDRVLDPFAGSGTTAVVAAALGRRCVTIDVSEANIESVRERLVKGAVRVS